MTVDPEHRSDRASIPATVPPTMNRRHAHAPRTEAEPPVDEHHAGVHAPSGRRLAVLTLGAFGDAHGLAPSVANVYGVLSLVFWSIMLVVVVKYLVFILRADNRGEGGVLALLALVLQRQHRSADRRRRSLFVILGAFGTALLYGDGIITPAISVLG